MSVSGRRETRAGGDESVEDRLMVCSQQLGMPLDPHTEPARSFSRFHHPIGAESGDVQPSRTIDGLVVGAVHLNDRPQDGAKAAIAECNGMMGRGRVGGLLVVGGVRQCVWDVLM